jgi:predicted transcriptional regulator of viral defense system
MTCSDLPDWYLQRRIAVVDLGSATWRKARAEVVPPGYAPDECLRRLAKAGRVRRIGRGRYVVVDPVRETPPIALASALFADKQHYVTTDAALAFHGAIDQPIRQIAVVLPRSRRPIDVGPVVVRPVTMGADQFTTADAYDTTIEGFKIRVATREQAVVDALAEPAWMVHGDLLAEVLANFTVDEIDRTASAARARSTAAAQRLGYLLEEADRPIADSLTSLRPVRAIKLRPGHRIGGPYSTRWRVYG